MVCPLLGFHTSFFTVGNREVCSRNEMFHSSNFWQNLGKILGHLFGNIWRQHKKFHFCMGAELGVCQNVSFNIISWCHPCQIDMFYFNPKGECVLCRHEVNNCTPVYVHQLHRCTPNTRDKSSRMTAVAARILPIRHRTSLHCITFKSTNCSPGRTLCFLEISQFDICDGKTFWSTFIR